MNKIFCFSLQEVTVETHNKFQIKIWNFMNFTFILYLYSYYLKYYFLCYYYILLCHNITFNNIFGTYLYQKFNKTLHLMPIVVFLYLN